MKLGVVGGGAWGTALAQVAAANGQETLLWALEDDVVASVNQRHENAVYLAGIPLSEAIRATSDLGDPPARRPTSQTYRSQGIGVSSGRSPDRFRWCPLERSGRGNLKEGVAGLSGTGILTQSTQRTQRAQRGCRSLVVPNLLFALAD